MGLFTKQTNEMKRRLIDIVSDVTLQVEATAKSRTAPIGATGQLRQNIVGSIAIETPGGQIVGVISSGAINDGEDYAEKQHDQELYHANREGQDMKFSFVDFATEGSGPFEKYRSGYANFQKTSENKFATKYIDRAIDLNLPLLKSELEREGFDVSKLRTEKA